MECGAASPSISLLFSRNLRADLLERLLVPQLDSIVQPFRKQGVFLVLRGILARRAAVVLAQLLPPFLLRLVGLLFRVRLESAEGGVQADSLSLGDVVKGGERLGIILEAWV